MLNLSWIIYWFNKLPYILVNISLDIGGDKRHEDGQSQISHSHSATALSGLIADFQTISENSPLF